MIDLHSHTFYSDGELVPAEQARRAEVAGVEVLGITDHADASNVEEAVERARRAKETACIDVLAGVEVTHVPPDRIAAVVERARAAGADLVVAHGETPVEPVADGTNRAAVEACVDVLGHPGMIDEAVAAEAAERGVHLEITARRGHALANGHVATVARDVDADLVVGTDAHHPDDFISRERAHAIARLAGLSEEEATRAVEDNPRALVDAL